MPHPFRHHVSMHVLAIFSLAATSFALPVQTTPSQNPAAPSDPDFCSLFLSPQLQQDLALSDDQVKKMGDLKFKLQTMLDNALKHVPAQQQSALSIARIADTCLTNCGKDARDILTPAQTEKLNALFNEGSLKPLTVETASVHTGRSPIRGMTFSKVDILYHYKDAASAADGARTGQIITPNGSASVHSENPVPVTGGIPARPNPPARAGRGEIPAGDPPKDFAEAIQLLQDQGKGRAPQSALWLSNASIDEKRRSDVLAALRPLLNLGDGTEHLPYVKAFVHWANADAVPDLVSLMEQHKGGLPNGYDQVWATTVPTLMELDMKAAEKVVLERKGELFFRNAVIAALKPIAFGDGPSKQHAEHLLVVLLVQ